MVGWTNGRTVCLSECIICAVGTYKVLIEVVTKLMRELYGTDGRLETERRGEAEAGIQSLKRERIRKKRDGSKRELGGKRKVKEDKRSAAGC